MNYKEAIVHSMKMLANDERVLFLGYNVKFGSQAYGTLVDIPPEKKLETPVAENLMTGLAMGLAIEGYRPIVFFERHDFMLNALDGIINHLDKILEMSEGKFKLPVIIRATIGSKTPLHPGPQHIQDFTDSFKKMIRFPVFIPETPNEIISAYEQAKNSDEPTIIIEKRELYESSKKEKILVTGGAGYVGSVLIPKLIDKDYDVRVLDLMLFGDNGLKDVSDKCEIIKGDIRDEDTLKESLEGVDKVIHLASISNDPSSDLDQELTKQVNFEATEKLLTLSKQKGVKRFIFASSSSVYGIKEEPNVTEDFSLEPLTIYSKTKAWSEEIVKKANCDNFTTVILRPATVCGYSPRMRLDLTVNILTDHAINREKISVFGGTQKRPNIHINDITDYYVSLLEIPKEKISGETFNAGYENHTVMNIAETVKEVIGKNVKIERTDTSDNRSYHISSEKIKNILNLKPKKTITDAVTDLKRAFDNNKIPNSSDSIYRNVDKMKELGFGKV